MEMFVDEYSLVLDPTCGSGNAIKVADKKGASSVLGIEKDKEFYDLAHAKYYSTVADEDDEL
jgi:predicted methyltransferase